LAPVLGQSERSERDTDPAANHSVRYFRVLLAVIAQNPPRLRARVPHQRPGAARSRRRDRSHGRERCRKRHPVDRARRRGPARRRL